MPVDLASLWDFSDPAGSEQRFAALLPTSSPEDAFILRTQIARSFGIRGDFDRARSALEALTPALAVATAEGIVRYHLELGRTLCSATHPRELQTDATRAAARAHWQRALDLAREEHLDALAIDAIHMMAFADPAPSAQLFWGLKALEVCAASPQPAARRWEASIRNNIGFALHALGRFDDALAEFTTARELRESMGNPADERAARWAIAWTLRALGRTDDAIQMQLQIDDECTRAGEQSPYACEELALLYDAKGDARTASRYRLRLAALRGAGG
jgi:tetratricopeptide (TPR) repeat protein